MKSISHPKISANDPDVAAWLVAKCREELAKPNLDEGVQRFWQMNLDFNLACIAKAGAHRHAPKN